MRTSRLAVILLTLSLLVAGALHLALTEEHFRASALLGAGFIVSGLAQIGIALISVGQAPHIPYRAIVVLNGVLIVLYLLHVTTGLPLPDSAATGAAEPGILGARDEIELPALATKLAEAIGISLALRMQRTQQTASADVSLQRAA